MTESDMKLSSQQKHVFHHLDQTELFIHVDNLSAMRKNV